MSILTRVKSGTKNYLLNLYIRSKISLHFIPFILKQYPTICIIYKPQDIVNILFSTQYYAFTTFSVLFQEIKFYLYHHLMISCIRKLFYLKFRYAYLCRHRSTPVNFGGYSCLWLYPPEWEYTSGLHGLILCCTLYCPQRQDTHLLQHCRMNTDTL